MSGGSGLAIGRDAALVDAIGVGYEKTVEPEMVRLLELNHELGSKDPPTKILADPHESLKEALNHLSRAYRADDNQKVEEEIRLGGWHINHARGLILSETIKCLKQITETLVKYLNALRVVISANTINHLQAMQHTANEGINKFWEAAYRGGAGSPRTRPSVQQQTALIKSIESLTEIADGYQNICHELKALHKTAPPIITIRRRHYVSRRIAILITVSAVILTPTAYFALNEHDHQPISTLISGVIFSLGLLSALVVELWGAIIYESIFRK